MFDLTKEEKLVLIFFLSCFIVGSGASFYKKRLEGPTKSCETQERKLLEQKREQFHKININTAPFTELIKLKGIGVKTAERIVDYRQENGPFFYKEDIMNIKGIGESKFNTIKNYIVTE